MARGQGDWNARVIVDLVAVGGGKLVIGEPQVGARNYIVGCTRPQNRVAVGSAGRDYGRVGDYQLLNPEAGQSVGDTLDEAAEQRALDIGFTQGAVGEEQVHHATVGGLATCCPVTMHARPGIETPDC